MSGCGWVRIKGKERVGTVATHLALDMHTDSCLLPMHVHEAIEHIRIFNSNGVLDNTLCEVVGCLAALANIVLALIDVGERSTRTRKDSIESYDCSENIQLFLEALTFEHSRVDRFSLHNHGCTMSGRKRGTYPSVLECFRRTGNDDGKDGESRLFSRSLPLLIWKKVLSVKALSESLFSETACASGFWAEP
jgi:hypothetical protein